MNRRRGIMAAADGAATDAAAAMESLPPLSAYPTLSAYELQRMENMRENEERLAELGLAPGGGIVNVRPQRQQNKTREKPKGERRPAAVGERKSSRVAGARALDLYVESEDARGAVTLGGDARALKLARQQREKAVASEGAAHDPLTIFGLGGMPEGDSELLDGERAAWTALYEAKRAKAAELQIESYKVAQHRSLCEMVRRVPASLDELPLCWGFGGSGVRVQKYGELFLDVLAPFADDLHAVHEAARAEYAAKAPDSVKAEKAEAKNEAKKRKRRRGA